MSSSALRTIPAAADVVINGGGVMGASAAFHLAEAGVRNIVVIERGELCCGSSGKPIGGVRAQFSDPLNIELGSRSLRAYREFPHRPGADIKLDTVGYLFLLDNEQPRIADRREVRTETRRITQVHGLQATTVQNAHMQHHSDAALQHAVGVHLGDAHHRHVRPSE